MMISRRQRTLATQVASQLAVAAAMVAVAGLVAPGDSKVSSSLLFGWALFASNAALLAVIASRLVERSGEKSNPGAKALSVIFFAIKPVWVALGVYIGLVSLNLRGELLVVGAAGALATFAATSYVLARPTGVSEKS